MRVRRDLDLPFFIGFSLEVTDFFLFQIIILDLSFNRQPIIINNLALLINRAPALFIETICFTLERK